MDYRNYAEPPYTPTPHSGSANPHLGPALVASRPLSDIREITEPSLPGSAQRNAALERANKQGHGLSRAGSARHERSQVPVFSKEEPTHERKDSWQSQCGPVPAAVPAHRTDSRQSRPKSPFGSLDGAEDESSVYSVPAAHVTRRSSSKKRNRLSRSLPRSQAVEIPPEPPRRYKSISNQSHSRSPVKETVDRLTRSNFGGRRAPSKTIIKVESTSTGNILDYPSHQHPRLKVDLQVSAPLFVGGSTVEGLVRIVVDEADRVRHRKTLTLERVSVDLLGVEELSGSKRHVFLALGNELVDLGHPPPNDMVESLQPLGSEGRSWILVPSVTKLPFLITLPLEVGPPPFQAKHARIRYVLCVTLTIKDAGRQLCVRSSQETAVLSVYDPEKALVSLPSPLTASDECVLHGRHSSERIVVTGGLHRQVWVSGTNIFADVHIINNSRKTLKKLELQVERIILCYRHAAAATLEMSASQARLFDQLERSVVCKAAIKHGSQGWAGVGPYSADLRTCNIELPRGHATIKCNKYFEVRYYLNIVVGTAHHRLVTVQLPIILIHMNSLDVPTNSVDQVAAAIEEKRGRHNNNNNTANTATNPAHRKENERPSHQQQDADLHRRPSTSLQGRAFAAPRTASLERQRQAKEDIAQLERALEASPRKHNPLRRFHHHRAKNCPPNNNENNRPSSSYPYGAEGGAVIVRGASVGPTYTNTSAAASFSFKTPPSNRKGRVIADSDAEVLRRRLGGAPGAGVGSGSAVYGWPADGGAKGASCFNLGGGRATAFGIDATNRDRDCNRQTPPAPPPPKLGLLRRRSTASGAAKKTATAISRAPSAASSFLRPHHPYPATAPDGERNDLTDTGNRRGFDARRDGDGVGGNPFELLADTGVEAKGDGSPVKRFGGKLKGQRSLNFGSVMVGGYGHGHVHGHGWRDGERDKEMGKRKGRGKWFERRGVGGGGSGLEDLRR